MTLIIETSTHSFAYIHIDCSRNVSMKIMEIQNFISPYFLSDMHMYINFSLNILFDIFYSFYWLNLYVDQISPSSASLALCSTCKIPKAYMYIHTCTIPVPRPLARGVSRCLLDTLFLILDTLISNFFGVFCNGMKKNWTSNSPHILGQPILKSWLKLCQFQCRPVYNCSTVHVCTCVWLHSILGPWLFSMDTTCVNYNLNM